jgi:hypothetical protein
MDLHTALLLSLACVLGCSSSRPILQWTHEGQGRWSRREIATVDWTGPDAFDIKTN